MSRLIVKNLPLDITDAELRGVFGKLGRVTDCSMRYTNNGKFRGFAFIGYENEELAAKALTYFDNSFVRTSKIHVEKCRNLFEHPSETKAALQNTSQKRKSEVKEPAVRKKRKGESQIDELIEKETANDERLAEFLNLHESGPIWADDDGLTKKGGRSTSQSKQLSSAKSSEPHKISEEVEESSEDTGKQSQRTLSAEQARIAEKIAESGRLFVRNLPYEGVSESDLETLFGRFGQVVELELPRDPASHRLKGFAIITFLFAEHALEAFRALDGTVFRGRLLHVLAGEPRRTRVAETDGAERPSLKAERVAARREAESRASSAVTRGWNALFLGTDAVVERTSAELGISKRDLLLGGGASDSAAVRVALGETQLVQETRELLERHGVVLGCFDTPATPNQRSRTTLLVKNLQPGVDEPQLHALLSRFGPLCRLVFPPRALTAIAEFTNETDARRAFRSLAYTKLKDAPLFLEFAPAGIFNSAPPPQQLKSESQQQSQSQPQAQTQTKTEAQSAKQAGVPEPQSGCSVLVRNLSFDTSEDGLRRLCEKCGAVRNVTIARKAHFNTAKKSKNVELLSLGYAFVEYATPRAAQRALRELQATELDGHQLELRLAERACGQTSTTDTQAPADNAAHEVNAQKHTSKNKETDDKDQRTKLVVRNVPFTANVAEIRALFAVFGELVRVSLPKRVAPARAGSADSPHRGFAFVQFATHADARRALEALSASTHLYGRRLVLDWAADAAAPQPV